MKILVCEYDLMWSSRIMKTLKELGHDPCLSGDGSLPDGDLPEAAIVNLSSQRYDPAGLIASLREKGIKVIAHAGHKEKQLLAVGESSLADRTASNSEVAHRLAFLLNDIGL